MLASLDFGYPWPFTHGHLIVALGAGTLYIVARSFRWPRPVRFLCVGVIVWSLAAFVVVQRVLGIDRRLALPTQAFLQSGGGRVLDMGAGSGRSTLMVLESRPKSFVVALDSFAEEYVAHFGAPPPGQDVPTEGTRRLLRNLQIAGVAERAQVKPGDMRELPFAAAEFDAIVSTYALDHLRRADREKALAEAARVLKPGGEFLLMVLHKDAWLSFAYGPIFMHRPGPTQQLWAESLQRAGLQVVEQGRRPSTFYFVARKP